MIAAVGYPTLRLIRIRFRNIELRDLEVGKTEEVNSFI